MIQGSQCVFIIMYILLFYIYIPIYIYHSSHIHDTDRPNKRICKTTPYLKKYASFSNTQELHLLYLLFSFQITYENSYLHGI